ncbi:MAG: glucokinase [Acidobacteria bacterium]|nr:glucokinase [Acidobacteriota bacterium]
MILAGDAGGTNLRLALFAREGGSFTTLDEKRMPSRSVSGIVEAARAFLNGRHVETAGFGIAGPVIRGRSQATNLPWIVDAAELSRELSIPHVVLVNDLAANGWGLSALPESAFHVINAGVEDPEGNGALISAGTGLGEAVLVREGAGFRPLPSEGGHTSFAPRNDHEIELLRALLARHGHVSYERILSGPGLGTLYRFERERSAKPEPAWLTEEIRAAGDPAPVVSKAALEERDDVCQATLHRFVRIYAAEAGNLALKALATGGLFVGGGIAPKILPILTESFFTAFCDKGRFAQLLSRIPVKVVKDERCALLGAALASMVPGVSRSPRTPQEG